MEITDDTIGAAFEDEPDAGSPWCDWCHSFHPDTTPHSNVPARDEHDPAYRDRDAYRAVRGRDMDEDLTAMRRAYRGRVAGESGN